MCDIIFFHMDWATLCVVEDTRVSGNREPGEGLNK
jgi:hypothetical protein